MRRRRINPIVIRVVFWKWNHIAVPDVINRAAIAPVRGHGLGSTMWYACAWCAIIRFLVGIDLVEEQIHRLESWLLLLLGGLKEIILLLLVGRRLLLLVGGHRRRWR